MSLQTRYDRRYARQDTRRLLLIKKKVPPLIRIFIVRIDDILHNVDWSFRAFDYIIVPVGALDFTIVVNRVIMFTNQCSIFEEANYSSEMISENWQRL